MLGFRSDLAEVAQSVEQWTENPRVDSSILSLGTPSLPSHRATGRAPLGSQSTWRCADVQTPAPVPWSCQSQATAIVAPTASHAVSRTASRLRSGRGSTWTRLCPLHRQPLDGLRHGVRHHLIPEPPEADPRARLTKEHTQGKSRWLAWTGLLWRVFNVDGLACVSGGRLRLHAVVRPPAALDFLNSLERSARPQPRGPPLPQLTPLRLRASAALGGRPACASHRKGNDVLTRLGHIHRDHSVLSAGATGTAIANDQENRYFL